MSDEANENVARFVSNSLMQVPGWEALTKTANGENTARWLNALVYSLGGSPLLAFDGLLVDTTQAEAVAISEDRVIRARGRVDGSFPVIAVYPRHSLKALEIIEPGTAIDTWQMDAIPNPRVRLTYGEATFNLPLGDSANRLVSRQVNNLLPALFEDLGQNQAATQN
ncbi:hypothetical protein ACTHQ6_09375 [Arthrobacter sp. SAFR-179]|uniref:hypothetical protein n=1 Tax=Arthrobacter sp. SAFR-179 TaxID=3387279 RepID=UPI003F7B7E48